MGNAVNRYAKKRTAEVHKEIEREEREAEQLMLNRQMASDAKGSRLTAQWALLVAILALIAAVAASVVPFIV